MTESIDSNKNVLDREILEGLKGGDRKIFELIFKTYYATLCSYANGLVQSFDSAEEIVQEVFINIWNSHAKIEIRTSLRAYLYKSVYYGCLNHIRNKKRNIDQKQFPDEFNKKAELLLLGTSNTPFTLMVSDELEKELERAIEKLPDQCCKIFCLSRFENLSYIAIAEKLGITVSTVKTQMSRAMTKLMENVDQYLK